jgi:hypothetical protein
MKLSLVLLSVFIVASVARASFDDTLDFSSFQTGLIQVPFASQKSKTASIFMVQDRMDLVGLEDPSKGVSQESRLELEEGDVLTVLDHQRAADGGMLVKVGLDRGEDSDAGEATLWVREADLSRPSLEEAVVDPDQREEFNYEVLPTAIAGRALVKKRARVSGSCPLNGRPTPGMTYCYCYVKLYLLKIGKVSVYLEGSMARQAVDILPRHGFQRIGGINQAQINDVCVYSGGKKNAGHIEIKVNGGWYYGYGVKPRPIAGNHKLLGCFRK